ncbi:MAG: ABC transporter permease [Puniceicoccaceae bacterium]
MSRLLLLFSVWRRELGGFFQTPAAFVALCAFPLGAIGFPWFLGGFLEKDEASLRLFFEFLPWVLSIFVPAVGMRIWAEERRRGSIEMLFTMAIPEWVAVLAKFLAAWTFVTLGLALTLPLYFTIEYLGNPDFGPVVSGYFGAILLAGLFLSIVCAASAGTKSQIVAFVVSAFPALLLSIAGYSRFNGLLLDAGLPVWMVDAVAGLGVVTHFEPMTRGLVAVSDLFYFVGFMVAHLFLNFLLVKR